MQRLRDFLPHAFTHALHGLGTASRDCTMSHRAHGLTPPISFLGNSRRPTAGRLIQIRTPTTLQAPRSHVYKMPPRKKAAAADPSTTTMAPTTTRATRSKTAAAAAPAAPAAATTPVPVPPPTPALVPASAPAPAPKSKAKGKGKAKRARTDSDNEDGDADDAPDTKKAKVDNTAASTSQQVDDDKPEPPKKMVTVLKRGAAPVDPVSSMVATHEVLSNAEGIWDAALNQTDVGKNANKFYFIQLLHPIGNSSSCTLFTRWGRVGENGQTQKKGPFNASVGVNEFKKQFKAKAGVNWERRQGMVAGKGKYQWIERSFEDEDEDKDKDSSGEPSSSQKENVEPKKEPDSTLVEEIQILCRLIFSASIIQAHLSSMNYDANKLPLGKLAKGTILNGFAALKTLSEVISQPDGVTAKSLGGFREAVETLTGRYYSIIPHVFGRNRPPIISEMNMLKRELDLVDALGDMEVASKLIASTVHKDADGNPINPIDAHFRSLNLTRMDPVARESKEFAALQAYARDTHGATHHYRVEVQSVFRVERQSETDAWMNSGFDKLNDGERLLLWHGSRTTNFAGILQQGLRIAPPEAPVTGYMFGKGVYFADMMSKSANYCHSYLSDNTGLLLLCEVAAKPFYEQWNTNYAADQACKGANALCTKGVGRSQPAEWQDAGAALENDALEGCHMPKGPGKDVDDTTVWLQYNEYIVYDPSQIRVRYLLMVKMG